MTEISCVYDRTADGRQTLGFALDLWQLTHQAPPFHVYLNSDERGATILDVGQPQNVIAMEAQLVHTDIQQKTSLDAASILVSHDYSSGITVDHNLAFLREDLSVLYPCREKTLLARGIGPILVPFGDGISALPSAALAFELARALALPVVLYHTTWRNPELAAAPAEEHMCEGARLLMAQLKRQAAQAYVEATVVVETADDVVEGVLQCALRHSARLVIMARSAKTTMGCYVKQTLAKTPIPLVALASKRESHLTI
jgi:hypothetical protein